jgi:hypothetical protein
VYHNLRWVSQSEEGITIPLSKVQKRVDEATHVSRRTLCWVLKEGENVETVRIAEIMWLVGLGISECIVIHTCDSEV